MCGKKAKVICEREKKDSAGRGGGEKKRRPKQSRGAGWISEMEF